jgi:membrane-associated phospholipid phosphatase
LGIYTSVFPSAHVSGAVASALGLVRCLGIRDHAARVALVYALLVSLATVYGRYHYAVDAVAGIAVGLGAAAMATAALRWGDRLSPEIAALRRTLSQ